VATETQWFTGEICGAKTRRGTACQRPAGEGTEHGPKDGWAGVGRCKRHGGSTPTHEKAAARQQAQLAARVMGAPLDIGPHEALAWCVRITAGEVAYCSERIAALEESEAVVADTMDRSHQELDRWGEVHDLVETRETSQARLHLWIEARAEAMKRLAAFSKLAVDAGVAEREVALGERAGEELAVLIRGLLGDLGVALDDERTREIVGRHLRTLDQRRQTIATLTAA
jgi:hypothetical protein